MAQDNGLIYLADQDSNLNQQAILNLSLSSANSDFLSLTAMALHPSFTDPEQPGYGTFYTAHTTEFDTDASINRLQLNDSDITFAFETVIIAWQYDFEKQKIDAQTPREILRIPIKTQHSAIKQLSFDPYQKSWNTDYGQLYISLNYIHHLKEQPLYSGVILRIHPMLFGALNYTVPDTNPFIKEPTIQDEIVVMGAQNVEHFFWAKNNHASIFVQHNNSEQHMLSKAKLGDNLLIQSESNFLWQQPSAMSSMLLYQGRNFLNLRNKMVFFSLLEGQWHLTSLALSPLLNESPIFEQLSAKKVLSPSSSLDIHQDKEGEIILFDRHTSRLYSLQPDNLKVAETAASQSDATVAGPNNYFWYGCLLLVLLLLLLIFIKRQNTAQSRSIHLLKKDFVRFEYRPTTKTILLFRAGQKSVNTTLLVDAIIRYEVLLNNDVIYTLDGQPENAISNQIEVRLRDHFTKEQSEKIADEQNRQIGITLSSKDEDYTICLYLRKGNNRVTSAKYFEVVDKLIDLCWVISKCLSPNVTETRVIPAFGFTGHNTSAAVSDPNTPLAEDKHMIKETAMPKTAAPKPVEQSISQTEIVNGLDKLVALHQQGYLTDEEFSLAKAKLLQ